MFNDEKIKKAVVIALSLLTVFLFSKTISEIKGWGLIGKDLPPQTVITVNGKGEMLVKPDIAAFSFSIQEESLVVGEAQDAVAKSESAILAFLAKSGVAKDDVKVSGYNIYPRYEYGVTETGSYPQPNGKQVLAAYVVTESVEVKVRKISDSGKIIGQLGELGGTNLSGLSFSVDKQDDFVKQAREKAIADAKAKATTLAKDLGVSLVRIVNFSEEGSNPVPIYYAKSAGMGMGMGTASAERAIPELPSGQNKITSNVSVTYEIR